ncbi:MAG: cell division protein FtsQ/DivIB, partial [Microbacteriaceae bacterium]
EGASRVDAQQVHKAVDGQLGTPLALLDLGRLTKELAAFPAIRSYVTQTVPPNTLVIRIVERQPIGLVAAGSGFELVDPAGVVLGTSATRVAGMPLIALTGSAKGSPAFLAAASVLQALPASLYSQVNTVTATTKDDVTLVLTAGERVLWGSAERSDYKARVLAALIAQHVQHVVQYDVSAPDSAVITRG